MEKVVKKPKKPLYAGTARNAIKALALSLPEPGKVARYICTSQQNNTKINGPVWKALLALAEHYDAKLLVSRFTYNRGAYERMSGYHVKPNTRAELAKYYDNHWFDEAACEYWIDRSVRLAPGLLFCGETDMLPTAQNPLSGLESYTGRSSGIFPHVKLAMESIAGFGQDGTKINYTTGTITNRNYVQRTAGQKASFHHCYGALLVEIDSNGNWFVRQLNADKRGTIYDLDVRAQRGVVSTGHSVLAVQPGDIHESEMDPVVRKLMWGEGGMVDVLRPKYQFFHDSMNFRNRNHHDMKDTHAMFAKYANKIESVHDEFSGLKGLLHEEAYREWCESVVVDSNHDNATVRWLKDPIALKDPVNLRLWHQMNERCLQAIEEQDKSFHLVEWQLRRMGLRPEIRFLREGEGFIIAPDESGGIQCGMHGHKGQNGSRGNPTSLARMGRRANTGHTHSAGIVAGLYTAGTCSFLRLGYNKADPSSWSHSHIVTYRNGKRAIVTMWAGKWRA